MALTIGTLVGYLKIDRSQWDRGLNAAKSGLDRMGKGVEALGKPGGLLLLAQQAVQLASSLGPATGALLAVPAVLGVVGVAMQTVKVATAGVGDAMSAVADGDAKKMEAALAKLVPEARAFVMAWDGVKQAFKPIQQAVQAKFFSGLGDDVAGLTKNTLPALGIGLNATATELNGLVREGIQAASTPLFAGQLEKTGKGTADVLRELHGSVAPIPGAILGVVNAGMPFIRTLAEMVGGMVKTKAEFLGSEAGAEAMRATIQRGVDTIKTLISIGQNLGNVVSAVFSRLNAGSGDFLTKIDALTARMAAWIASTQGQKALDGLFAGLAQAAQHAAEVLPMLISAAQLLFNTLNGLPDPVKDFITQALVWATVLGPISSKLVLVGSAALGLLRGVGAVGSFTASVFRIVTASTAAEAATARSSASMIARMAAAAVSGAVSAAKTVAGWVAMGAAATVNGIKIVAGWALSAAGAVAQGAVMVGSMIATAASVVAGWVVMGTQSLIQAARMAAAWLIAMGPVGLIIAVVVGLVALIIANWDTIVSATKAAWDWLCDIVSGAIDWVVSFVKDHWRLLLSIIMGPLGLIIVFVIDHWSQIKAAFRSGVDTAIGIFQWFGQLPSMIGGWFASVYRAAVDKLGELIGWVTGLPGRILSALGNMGSMLYESGASMLRGLIDGFMSMVQTVKNKVSGALQSVRDLFPFSPAKTGPFSGKGWVSYSGASIASALAKGITSGTGGVLAATQGLMAAAQAKLSPSLSVTGSGGSMQQADKSSADNVRAPIHIENYHPPADADPHAVAVEWDWLSKNGG
ncbi:MAG: hypothetical protein ABIQ18_02370 [Umezawaea sp.]